MNREELVKLSNTRAPTVQLTRQQLQSVVAMVTAAEAEHRGCGDWAAEVEGRDIAIRELQATVSTLRRQVLRAQESETQAKLVDVLRARLLDATELLSKRAERIAELEQALAVMPGAVSDARTAEFVSDIRGRAGELRDVVGALVEHLEQSSVRV